MARNGIMMVLSWQLLTIMAIRVASNRLRSREISHKAAELLRETSGDRLSLKRNGSRRHRLARTPSRESFTFVCWNILAKYLGRNTEPWFMFGAGIPYKMRQSVKSAHQFKEDGEYKNKGWPKYAEAGGLSPTQVKRVEIVDDLIFQWNGSGSRRSRIAQEIVKHDPDLVVLEELDVFSDVHHDINYLSTTESVEDIGKAKARQKHSAGRTEQFGNEMFATGPVFDGYFGKRPRSKDGVGIFYRRSRFELLGQARHEFLDRLPDRDREVRDRIFCMTMLKDRQTQKRLLVVGTHLAKLPEEPAMEEVRKQELDQMFRQLDSQAGQYDALLLSGDMNSDALHPQTSGWPSISAWQTPAQKGLAEAFDPQRYLDQLGTKDSSLATARKCTSKTEDREVWIDFAYYTPRKLRVLATDGPSHCPPDGVVMPNAQHPSDHLLMEVKFQWESDQRWKQITSDVVAPLRAPNTFAEPRTSERVVSRATDVQLTNASDNGKHKVVLQKSKR